VLPVCAMNTWIDVWIVAPPHVLLLSGPEGSADYDVFIRSGKVMPLNPRSPRSEGSTG
jgi:hypothetical protein